MNSTPEKSSSDGDFQRNRLLFLNRQIEAVTLLGTELSIQFKNFFSAEQFMLQDFRLTIRHNGEVKNLGLISELALQKKTVPENFCIKVLLPIQTQEITVWFGRAGEEFGMPYHFT